jgi:hypothetical protein
MLVQELNGLGSCKLKVTNWGVRVGFDVGGSVNISQGIELGILTGLTPYLIEIVSSDVLGLTKKGGTAEVSLLPL